MNEINSYHTSFMARQPMEKDLQFICYMLLLMVI